MGLILEIVDMEKLATAFFDHLQIDSNEYGAVGVDGKRPFGNSDVEHDILKILGYNVEGRDESDPNGKPCRWSDGQREYAAALYRNLPSYLRRKYGSKGKTA
jgi:hypothetical protein